MNQNENHKQGKHTRVCVIKSVGLEKKNPRQNIDTEAFEKTYEALTFISIFLSFVIFKFYCNCFETWRKVLNRVLNLKTCVKHDISLKSFLA